MRFENFTPYSAMRFANEDVHQRVFDVVFVKASYGFDASGRLYPLKEQKFPSLTDNCFGDVNVSPLRHPSDMVPFKTCTDILLHARSFAPSGKPEEKWTCGIEIKGSRPFFQSVEITGPRHWEPHWRGQPDLEPHVLRGKQRGFRKWKLSEPEPISTIAMDYTKAFGGSVIGDNESDVIVDHRNPLGTGWIDENMSDHRFPVPAPQMLQPGQVLKDPYEILEPIGFGPIPPAWLPRRPLGGTYDQNWQDNIAPHWPLDYSFQYHSSAPNCMQYDGYLRGNEKITMENIGKKGSAAFTLPGDRIFSHQVKPDGTTKFVAMHLDTLLIDFWSENIADWSVSVTWRQVFLEGELQQLNMDCASELAPGVLAYPEVALELPPDPVQLFQQQEGKVA